MAVQLVDNLHVLTRTSWHSDLSNTKTLSFHHFFNLNIFLQQDCSDQIGEATQKYLSWHQLSDKKHDATSRIIIIALNKSGGSTTLLSSPRCRQKRIIGVLLYISDPVTRQFHIYWIVIFRCTLRLRMTKILYLQNLYKLLSCANNYIIQSVN